MITCTECGKMNGHGEVGKNWICDDCKVVYKEQEQQTDGEEPKSDEENRPV
ncbi:hypothetical protein [Paenibacillus montanisoli]|uniref:hypothetical protein n=1 Tax=Paenibacillus montanisoli TaxID=2081970 RepID=UPI0014041F43|nr:hypothetical protein [Paenibacillus montanisoli]